MKLYKHKKSGEVILHGEKNWGIVLMDSKEKPFLGTITRRDPLDCEEFDGIIKMKPSSSYHRDKTFVIVTEKRIFFHKEYYNKVLYYIPNTQSIGYFGYNDFLYYLKARCENKILDGIIEFKNKTKPKMKKKSLFSDKEKLMEVIREQVMIYDREWGYENRQRYDQHQPWGGLDRQAYMEYIRSQLMNRMDR
ncbi:MAG: hypothetical protein SLAVMIC_00873 [uncultured marine phage]|uniref:Uncharacterized protein n=1 Tax=uncultured marine phage TaxID=707152 RepID=A0A8D9C9Q4_9VIRU|nr:MAG: hypothetical protein SLAVMIC_00873 [uncultured marine phage]